MPRFGSSITARLVAFSFALALVGGGIAARLAAPASLAVMSAGLLLAMTLGIVAMATGLDDYPFECMLGAIVLPVALFLYVIGLGVIMQYVPTLGYTLIALGVGALGFAIRPTHAEARVRHERRPSHAGRAAQAGAR